MSEKKAHSVKVPRLYKAAAKILEGVIAGGNLKTLVYNKHYFNIKALYALVVETLRHAKVLDYVIEKSEILLKEERLDPSLARILISELLWGKKQLPGNSRPIETVISYKEKLLNAEQCHEELLYKEQESRRVILPRYVRVNTICKSVEDVVKYFHVEGWKKMGTKFKSYPQYLENICSLTEDQFAQDFHIKELLVFPAKTDFHEHDLYINGSIILQDKASCLPAYLLAPEPGSTVLDMCAAPGMKTTHLAALMENTGKIYAVERDPKRYELLRNTVQLSGATCVETLLGDSLTIGNTDVPGVQYILVDPSCSGSGIVDRIELEPERSSDPSRLYKLGGFQIKLLHRALSEFPLAKKVIYSTCSLNVEENEEVVCKVMSYFPDPPEFKLVKKILPDGWKNRGSKQYAGGKYCLYSRPEEDLTNGFFIAVFERYDFTCVNGKYPDKCIGNSKISEETILEKPEYSLPQSETTSSHDILKDDDKKSKYHKKTSKLKIHGANTATLRENIEEQFDGPTRKATADGKLCQTEPFRKKDSVKHKHPENLSHETEQENFGQGIKATKLRKRRSVCDNADSPQETISGCLRDNDSSVANIISEKLPHIGSNISSKDETGDRMKSADPSYASDIISVNHKQKKPKITSESYVWERSEKPGNHSCVLEKQSSKLNIPKKVLNIKKKKKKLAEKSGGHGDVQAFEDSNNVIGDRFDSLLNKFSQETGHSKMKKRKKEKKLGR